MWESRFNRRISRLKMPVPYWRGIGSRGGFLAAMGIFLLPSSGPPPSRKTLRKRLADIVPLILVSSLLTMAIAPVPGQVTTPSAGLTRVQIIPVPNWTTTGATQASFDIFSFDPGTHTMYFADRVNKGVTAIDTQTNTIIGTIQVPGCTGTGSCPSGVLVIPDLHKLVVTDRDTKIFIYDLRAPGPPTTLTLAMGGGTDELDYDPLNHRVYVGNTTAPYFLTVVDVVNNSIIGPPIPLPSNPEQPRFDPADGFVYLTIPDDDHQGAGSAVLRIDTRKSGAAAIVKTFAVANCEPHGIDIDPVTNTAILACSRDTTLHKDFPQALIDLDTGNVLATFPQVTGADGEGFNRSLRRWYVVSDHNANSGVMCPQDTTAAFPVVGVFSAPTKPNQMATLVGADCVGRNSHGLGIDPFSNNIYVGARQFPADPRSSTTGQPGVLVFHDPAPPAQATPERSQAVLAALRGSSASGLVSFTLPGRMMSVQANVQGLPEATPTLLMITTTVGNEVVTCAGGVGTATCTGTLLGDPLIGGIVMLAAGGRPVAQGRIAAVGVSGTWRNIFRVFSRNTLIPDPQFLSLFRL